MPAHGRQLPDEDRAHLGERLAAEVVGLFVGWPSGLYRETTGFGCLVYTVFHFLGISDETTHALRKFWTDFDARTE